MKKRIWIIVAVAVCAAAAAALYFAGAFCSHDWLSAGCDEKERCALCGRERGEPLGHDWQEADCRLPETCARCSLTRGEALPHNWQAADCRHPETCADCGITQGDALPHNWQAPDCHHPETCATCGTTRGRPLDHNWQDTGCLTAQVCARCGEEGDSAPGHVWQEATCVTPKTCGSCGLTEGEPVGHSWQEATCLAPRTCAACGQTEGEPVGHVWLEATCLAPRTCAACGLTEGGTIDHRWQRVTCTRPETCAVCGTTRGSALGHIWTDATCTTPRRCTRCGSTTGSPLGHKFAETQDGTKLCSVCGRSVETKYIAITFDDGPSGSVTDTLLAGLQQRGVKATFFICGYRIRSYPWQPQQVLDAGHEIGLHTNNHVSLNRLDAAGIRWELESMLQLLPAGFTPRLMRPPGGGYNSTVRQVCGELGLTVAMWSVDPRDWETNNVDTIVNRVVNGARDGSIILMHELKNSSVTAALIAIDRLQAMGYEFVTVSELAAIRGRELLPGKVIFGFE